jgi:phenazine biosynthesis protein phzE
MIRTAEIDRRGGLRIGVGATLVRHSDPGSEVAETRAKAAGLLRALEPDRPALGADPRVQAALRRRNERIADFWLRGAAAGAPRAGAGRRTLVVDAEDAFTAMIAHQLRSLDLAVTVRPFDDVPAFGDFDLVVMGPGPGDPARLGDPRVRTLRAQVVELLGGRRPFIAVCLSHQVLGLALGFELYRREKPNQGAQHEISLFGARERVGFYNTFAVHSERDEKEVEGIGRVEVCRDPESGEVHALRGPRFRSMQFHPESVLTVDGPRILGDAVAEVLAS